MGDVEKTDEPEEPQESAPGWLARLGRAQAEAFARQEVSVPVHIILWATAIYLGAQYIEPLKEAKIPFGEYIPFSFAYLRPVCLAPKRFVSTTYTTIWLGCG